jgi:hypothetical protein
MTKSRKPNRAKTAAPAARKNALKRARLGSKRGANTAPLRSSRPRSPARPSKKAAIVALLERPNGAVIGDLINATGWQQHSVRAALTGLRKEGKELVRSKDAGGVTHYRLAAA